MGHSLSTYYVPGKAAGTLQNPTSAPQSRRACAHFTAQGDQVACLSSSCKERAEQECDSRPGPTGEIVGSFLRAAEGASSWDLP